MIDKYLELGWVVLPIAVKGAKRPKGRDWPDAAPETDLSKYPHGAYLVCGERSGLTVIDLDSEEWIEAFEDIIREHPTPYATTPSGGRHIYIQHRPGWSNLVGIGGSIDIRNDGGGVVLPVGSDDREWYDDLEPWSCPLASPEPYERLLREIEEGATYTESATLGVHSNLTGLLDNAPGTGERNDWLAKIAGHLAPWIPYDDAFSAMLRRINLSLDEPLDEQEVETTVAKMWGRDRDRNNTGALDQYEISDGKLWYWRGQGKQRDKYEWVVPAIRVTRIYRDRDGQPSWEITAGERSTILHPSHVHQPVRLATVLGNIEVVIYPQATGANTNGAELQLWLQAQKAPETKVYPWWGWNVGAGWVGLDAEGLGPEEYRPIIGWLDRPDLIEQIPTWQQDDVAAVFCSWVALQAVKGKIPMAIEPNVVLQGTAGSGKTRGLFSFGARLTGSKRASSGTFATMRDRLAGHRSGILVIDDHADLEANTTRLLELYRVSTAGEALTLKQIDSSGKWVEKEVPLVGSILASGESLSGLSNDRALRDRSIILEVPPAAERMSLQDPTQPQWLDILEAFRQCGSSDETGAHQLAGPFIRRLLEAADELGAPEVESGERVEAKLSLLKYGARLWHKAYPGSRTYHGQTLPEAVDQWCSGQASKSDWQETTLIRQILPEMVDPSVGALDSIAIVEGRVVYHPQRLARAWQRNTRGDRSREIGALDNLRRETNLLKDSGHADYSRTIRMGGRPTRVWTLSEAASKAVLEAAGVTVEEDE